jgi:hypothetical protein
MVHANSELGRLHLTADLQPKEGWVAKSLAKAGRVRFEKLQRFPPVEDVVANLDTVASRTITD